MSLLCQFRVVKITGVVTENGRVWDVTLKAASIVSHGKAQKTPPHSDLNIWGNLELRLNNSESVAQFVLGSVHNMVLAPQEECSL